MFALCIDCWRELGSTERRLPYYRQRAMEWRRWDEYLGDELTDVDAIMAEVERNMERMETVPSRYLR